MVSLRWSPHWVEAVARVSSAGAFWSRPASTRSAVLASSSIRRATHPMAGPRALSPGEGDVHPMEIDRGPLRLAGCIRDGRRASPSCCPAHAPSPSLHGRQCLEASGARLDPRATLQLSSTETQPMTTYLVAVHILVDTQAASPRSAVAAALENQFDPCAAAVPAPGTIVDWAVAGEDLAASMVPVVIPADYTPGGRCHVNFRSAPCGVEARA